MQSKWKEISFTDEDIVDENDFISKGEYNPHNIHPFLLHDHGFCICVVFAENLQDALDKAVDANKLDDYKVDEEDSEDNYSYLGNAREPFDIESLGIEELPNPAFSFCALFNAMQKELNG